MPGESVSRGDRHQGSGDRRHGKTICGHGGEVQSYRLGHGRDHREPEPLAPQREPTPVPSVGPPGTRSPGSGGEFPGALNEYVELTVGLAGDKGTTFGLKC